MEEHVYKFMELLTYVGYIKEERVNIQIFLGGLPPSYRDRIELSNPQTLKETIRMVTCCYERKEKAKFNGLRRESIGKNLKPKEKNSHDHILITFLGKVCRAST